MLESITVSSWIAGELNNPLSRGVNFQIELSDLDPLIERYKKLRYTFSRFHRYTIRHCCKIVRTTRIFDTGFRCFFLLRFTHHLRE